MRIITLISYVFIISIVACDNDNGSGQVISNDRDPNALTTKIYDVRELRKVVDVSKGFRVFFEESGLDISLRESIFDSPPMSDIVTLRLTADNHKKVEDLFRKILTESKAEDGK